MTAGVTVRRATLADSAHLLAWRNDAVTRANSVTTNAVPLDAHKAWLTATLADPSRVLLIGERHGERVGMVRLDLDDDRFEVSITVAPDQRGRGIGRALLRAALDHFRQDPAVAAAEIEAFVRPVNEASLALFVSLGFIPHEQIERNAVDLVRLVLPSTARGGIT